MSTTSLLNPLRRSAYLASATMRNGAVAAAEVASPLCTPVCQQQRRDFSTSPSLSIKTIRPARLPKRVIPPYPYGERRVYKQSNKGLYGSARIQFGNNVSEKHQVKTQRFWRPNVHVRVYMSPSLGAKVKTRLTMRVLKTIKREGGLENYLLKDKPARVKELGPSGWNLRCLLMQTRAVQERLNLERVAMGLNPQPVRDYDDIVSYALDAATPGKLSLRSRETLADLELEDVFTIGDDAAAVGGFTGGAVEEITDEMEAEFIQKMEAQEQQQQQPKA
ncbi:large subunit ribosomal protein L28 [Geosmithia morbida]|uniref:Large subunit ribosomal protein L28 n=1 Tax=Geosmithia morbida TaxID=1094350 RepID=A0A9P5D8W8_9HYPO|nr:large subunit ribosomal protein L28 [Geosmithia morbida]KAF4125929.1 large subunit ribosomal protein L28 [Geosmithia morbida]